MFVGSTPSSAFPLARTVGVACAKTTTGSNANATITAAAAAVIQRAQVLELRGARSNEVNTQISFPTPLGCRPEVIRVRLPVGSLAGPGSTHPAGILAQGPYDRAPEPPRSATGGGTWDGRPGRDRTFDQWIKSPLGVRYICGSCPGFRTYGPRERGGGTARVVHRPPLCSAGAPGRIRTLDPQIRSLMLYPLSYRRARDC